MAESTDDNFTTLATELKVHHWWYLHLMIWSKELILTEPIALYLGDRLSCMHLDELSTDVRMDNFFHQPNLGTTCLARRSGFAWEAHVSQSTNGQPSTSLALLLDSSQGLGFLLGASSIFWVLNKMHVFFGSFLCRKSLPDHFPPLYFLLYWMFTSKRFLKGHWLHCPVDFW